MLVIGVSIMIRVMELYLENAEENSHLGSVIMICQGQE